MPPAFISALPAVLRILAKLCLSLAALLDGASPVVHAQPLQEIERSPLWPA